MCAIRECFEETGILLVNRVDDATHLLAVETGDREHARHLIHANTIRFQDWVKERKGVLDVGRLSPSIFDVLRHLNCTIQRA